MTWDMLQPLFSVLEMVDRMVLQLLDAALTITPSIICKCLWINHWSFYNLLLGIPWVLACKSRYMLWIWNMQTQAECSTEIEIGCMGFSKKQQELVKKKFSSVSYTVPPINGTVESNVEDARKKILLTQFVLGGWPEWVRFMEAEESQAHPKLSRISFI